MIVLVAMLCGSAIRTTPSAVSFAPSEHRFDSPLSESETYTLSLTMRNGTRQQVTLIGAPDFCGPDGCAVLTGFPQVLDPGTEGRIIVRFKAGAPGSFAHEVPIYTDCPGQPEVLMKLVGEVREAPAPLATGPRTGKSSR